jgi:hypothetical protein
MTTIDKKKGKIDRSYASDEAELLRCAKEMRDIVNELKVLINIPEDRGMAKNWNEDFVSYIFTFCNHLKNL